MALCVYLLDFLCEQKEHSFESFFCPFFQACLPVCIPTMSEKLYILGSVVYLAVIPNELYISQTIFHSLVLIIIQILFDCTKIHGFLYHKWIVKQSIGHIIDWSPELEGIRCIDESLEKLRHFFMLLFSHKSVAVEDYLPVHQLLCATKSDAL